MTEDLAGRLRWLAEVLEGDPAPSQQTMEVHRNLEELAQEWERLEGVREKIGPVLQAVREWAPTGERGPALIFQPELARLLAAQIALEDEVAKVAAPPAPDWRPGTWGEVISGDRVRLGTAEADVEFVVPMTVAPSGLQQISVKLFHREKAYVMDPRGQVEILRGASGQAVDEAGVEILASWGPDFVDAVGILREAFPGLEAVNDG